MDDEDYVRASLVRILAGEGYQTFSAPTGEEALKMLESQEVDVFLFDYRLPGMNGIDAIVEGRKISPDTSAVLITGVGTDQVIIEAFTKGRVDYYLTKPFTVHELKKVMSMALKSADVRRMERMFHDELQKKIREATAELLEKNRLLKARESELASVNDKLREEQDQLKSLNEKLETLSITDGLTGLYNFRHFSLRLAEEFYRSSRYNGRLSLLMIDLDDFKNVNDQYGHLMGDETLRRVAEALLVSSRHADLVARYGGEEFALILPEVGLEGAAFRAERLRQSISELEMEHDGAKAKITISIGVATCGSSEINSPQELVRAADLALYHAKEIGKNCVVLFRDGSLKALGKENIMTESQKDHIMQTLSRSALAAHSAGEVMDGFLRELKDVYGDAGEGLYLSVRRKDPKGNLVEAARLNQYRGKRDVEGIVSHVMETGWMKIISDAQDPFACFPLRSRDQEGASRVSGVLMMNRSPAYPPFLAELLDELSSVLMEVEERNILKGMAEKRKILDDTMRRMLAGRESLTPEEAFSLAGPVILDIFRAELAAVYSVKKGKAVPLVRFTGAEGLDSSTENAVEQGLAKAMAHANEGGLWNACVEEASSGSAYIIAQVDAGKAGQGFLLMAASKGNTLTPEDASLAESLALMVSVLLYNGKSVSTRRSRKEGKIENPND